MSSTVFPTGGRSVVEQMCAQFPELHVNDDAKQRDLITKIQEQFAYQYGASWGGKKRTGLSDEEKSKDSMAFREPSGNCSTWDTFQGNAEATILVNDGAPPDFPDMPPADATFMPVTPHDWLGDDPNPEPPPVDETDVEDIYAILEVMQTQQAEDTQLLLARDDANTQKILDTIDSIKTQVEESLQKALALIVIKRRGEGEPVP
jgi:hypothetical protein